MKLGLRIVCRYIDQLWCQAIVIFLFEEDLIFTGHLQKLNNKLGGHLTLLKEKSFLTGKKGEVMLIAPQNRINSDKLLTIGLGHAGNWSLGHSSDVVLKASTTIDQLNLSDILIIMPSVIKKKTDYYALMKSIIHNLVEHYYREKGNTMEFFLKVVFLIEEHYLNNLKSLEKELRSYLNPIIDCSIIIDNRTGY